MPQTSVLVGRTYHIKTFGCQMNLHDSERVAGLLDSCGCIMSSSAEDADIVVFMTCCVREKADTRLYGQVSSMSSLVDPPSGRRIVCVGGCIAQRDGERLREKLSNVDVVFGTSALAQLPGLIEQALEGDGSYAVLDVEEEGRGFASELPSHREHSYHAWVPIMRGCNNFCTFCIVPHVRGREQSRDFDEIVYETNKLVEDGVREICLLGQNVNSYGRDRYGAPRFAELLRAVGSTGIERIRFTSSHPKDLSDETIAAMAETEAVMPQLHLAVQSGSTRVLKAMGRRYSREDYLNLVSRIRAAMPNIFLSTDIIVGFPGEQEEDFEQTLSLVKEVDYASAFTFIYSKREGTPAALLEDNTPSEVIHERFDRLAKLVEDLAFKANQPFANQRVEVLVEGLSKREGRILTGHSPYNQTVHFECPSAYEPQKLIGSMVDVEVEQARTWYLRGSMTGEPR
ncbi:MAG: tRNA (N6-isopentenyl adenosine(37)-C2)-methylthiotransferase MiaB [Atopobiaceae bacterium]|nr:tRNA (N6-isopentenyl adenosine(37)-C2)-methylthiotransferase MiaB [Atopobiaceae bacterium]